MVWTDQLKDDSLSWLLEEEELGVRYLAMRDLFDLPPDAADLSAAREDAYKSGPISKVLNKMRGPGWWTDDGPGYSNKYRNTVWSVIMLSQLGADVRMDERIQKACMHLMDNALTENGQFTANGWPSGIVDCLHGNLCSAMLDLGFEDPRLEKAFEWMARSVTGEGVAPMKDKKAPLRYYSGKLGPDFLCGANNKLPCAWGAVKVMLAFSKLPHKKRTPLINDAIQRGIDFLLGVDPATAGYPNGWAEKPSGNWWKFGFPVFYVTDLLQNVEALVRLGLGSDPRLENALEIIRQKQDEQGRWALEYDYAGKTWVRFGEKNQPNKWVTYRAMLVLKKSLNLFD